MGANSPLKSSREYLFRSNLAPVQGLSGPAIDNLQFLKVKKYRQNVSGNLS